MTLPFGWKLSPPTCQRVVARHIGETFACMRCILFLLSQGVPKNITHTGIKKTTTRQFVYIHMAIAKKMTQLKT